MKYKKYIIGIIVVLVVGFSSSIFSLNAPTYYATLKQLSFAPSPKVFGPVWTILYIMIGTVLGRLLTIKDKNLLAIFTIQLILNFTWTAVFFSLKLQGLAVINILALLGTIIYLMIKMYQKKEGKFALVLIPYLMWVSFASILNISIFFLNQ